MQNQNSLTKQTSKLSNKLQVALCSTLLVIAIVLSSITTSFLVAVPHATAVSSQTHIIVSANVTDPCIPMC